MQGREVKIEEVMEESRAENELDVRRGLSVELWRDSREDERGVVWESGGEGGFGESSRMRES